MKAKKVGKQSEVSTDSEKLFPGLALFDKFPVASIFFRAADGKIVSWNHAVSGLTGFDRDGFVSIVDFVNTLIPTKKPVSFSRRSCLYLCNKAKCSTRR
jgi:hypothetical protein